MKPSQLLAFTVMMTFYTLGHSLPLQGQDGNSVASPDTPPNAIRDASIQVAVSIIGEAGRTVNSGLQLLTNSMAYGAKWLGDRIGGMFVPPGTENNPNPTNTNYNPILPPAENHPTPIDTNNEDVSNANNRPTIPTPLNPDDNINPSVNLGPESVPHVSAASVE